MPKEYELDDAVAHFERWSDGDRAGALRLLRDSSCDSFIQPDRVNYIHCRRGTQPVARLHPGYIEVQNDFSSIADASGLKRGKRRLKENFTLYALTTYRAHGVHVQNNADLVDLDPGQRVTRSDLDEEFGGGIQGGMITPAGGHLMFLFSDPKAASNYGYDTDGWADEEAGLYYYTGTGVSGSQSLTTGKNKILLDTIVSERQVYLFLAVDHLPDSKARLHEYLGRFELVAEDPYHLAETLGEDGYPRSVVVFHLVRSKLQNGPFRVSQGRGQVYPRTRPTASKTNATEIAPEKTNVKNFQRGEIGPGVGERRERDMEDQLIDWLGSKGLTTRRFKIDIAGETHPLYTDAWVPKNRELFEAKADSRRSSIRMAIGQLLDYRRHISPPPERCTIVVPLKPSLDLCDLVKKQGLSLAIFDGRNLNYID